MPEGLEKVLETTLHPTATQLPFFVILARLERYVHSRLVVRTDYCAQR